MPKAARTPSKHLPHLIHHGCVVSSSRDGLDLHHLHDLGLLAPVVTLVYTRYFEWFRDPSIPHFHLAVSTVVRSISPSTTLTTLLGPIGPYTPVQVQHHAELLPTGHLDHGGPRVVDQCGFLEHLHRAGLDLLGYFAHSNVLCFHLPLCTLSIRVVPTSQYLPLASQEQCVPSTQAHHHYSVATRPCARDRGGQASVPLVPQAKLSVLIVTPAPRLARLVHHHSMRGIAPTSNMADTNFMQGLEEHGLVDVVLGVVVVLLQLARLQCVMPLSGPTEQEPTTLGVKLGLLGPILTIAISSILSRSFSSFHDNKVVCLSCRSESSNIS